MIPDLLVGEVIFDVGLLQDHISGILFVLDHPIDLQPLPAFPGRRLHTPCDHVVHDNRRSFPVDKALKDFPNNGGFILLDQEKCIVCMVKAVKRNFDFMSGFKPLPDAPLYILRNAPALLLRE